MTNQELEDELRRVKLLNQALWELLREHADLTDADLDQRAKEIDARDGVLDGKFTQRPLRCPDCKQISSSLEWQCVYCGLKFDKPAMG